MMYKRVTQIIVKNYLNNRLKIICHKMTIRKKVYHSKIPISNSALSRVNLRINNQFNKIKNQLAVVCQKIR